MKPSRTRAFTPGPHRIRRGDAAAAIAASPRTIGGELFIGGQEHFYLETQCAIARWMRRAVSPWNRPLSIPVKRRK